jgi:hypothetical protein
MAPRGVRYDKALQNIMVTLIICGTLVSFWGVMLMKEDIKGRAAAYRYCIEMHYSPRQCYQTVFKAPRPWGGR